MLLVFMKEMNGNPLINEVADHFEVTTDYLHGRTDNPNPMKEMSSYDDLYISNYKIINSIILTHEGRESAEVIAKYTARKANLDIIRELNNT